MVWCSVLSCSCALVPQAVPVPSCPELFLRWHAMLDMIDPVLSGGYTRERHTNSMVCTALYVHRSQNAGGAASDPCSAYPRQACPMRREQAAVPPRSRSSSSWQPCHLDLLALLLFHSSSSLSSSWQPGHLVVNAILGCTEGVDGTLAQGHAPAATYSHMRGGACACSATLSQPRRMRAAPGHAWPSVLHGIPDCTIAAASTRGVLFSVIEGSHA